MVTLRRRPVPRSSPSDPSQISNHSRSQDVTLLLRQGVADPLLGTITPYWRLDSSLRRLPRQLTYLLGRVQILVLSLRHENCALLLYLCHKMYDLLHYLYVHGNSPRSLLLRWNICHDHVDLLLLTRSSTSDGAGFSCASTACVYRSGLVCQLRQPRSWRCPYEPSNPAARLQVRELYDSTLRRT